LRQIEEGPLIKQHSGLQDGRKDWDKVTDSNLQGLRLGGPVTRARMLAVAVLAQQARHARSDFNGQFGLEKRACSVVTYSHRRIINRIPLFLLSSGFNFWFIFSADFTIRYSPSSRCHRQRVGNGEEHLHQDGNPPVSPYCNVAGPCFFEACFPREIPPALPTAIHLCWAPSPVLRDAHDWPDVL